MGAGGVVADRTPTIFGEVKSLEAELEEYRQRYEDLLKERAVEMREAAARVLEEADERRQSEERFRVLVERSSDLILIVDAEARVTYCSPSVERLIGYSQDEVTGRSADEFIEGEDLAIIAALRSQSGSAPPLGEGELRARTKSGAVRWFGWAASDHLDDETVRGVVINARDITDRGAGGARAARERAAVPDADRGFPDMIYMIGADGRVQYVNGRGARRFGVPAEQLVGLGRSSTCSRGAAGARITTAVEGCPCDRRGVSRFKSPVVLYRRRAVDRARAWWR